MLGSLCVVAPPSALAQCNPPLRVTIKFGNVPADVTFSPLPAATSIPIVVQVENCSGAPVLTTDGFSSTDFFRRLYFKDPGGGTIVNQGEEQLHFDTQRLSNVFCLSRNGVLQSSGIPVVPVQQLAGPPSPFFREYLISAARTAYDLSLPGYYTVSARIDFLTFDGSAKITDCDQFSGTTLVPVGSDAPGHHEFSITANTLQLVIAGPAAANSSIVGTGPVVANGADASTVTITLKDAKNQPVVGMTPTFSASGSNNILGACSATTGAGVSTCTLQSTTAEVKTLSIVTPVSVTGGQVTFASLGVAKVWVGLANSDDVGIRFDLKAVVSKGGVQVGSGQLASVPGGSNGFNNAQLDRIPLDLTGSGTVPGPMSIDVFVRTACVGSNLSSGTARLWLNGASVDTGAARDAGSRLEAVIGGVPVVYFLRGTPPSSLTLLPVAGSARTFIDVKVGAKCSSTYEKFGTWTQP